jgi:hypothetical protein
MDKVHQPSYRTRKRHLSGPSTGIPQDLIVNHLKATHDNPPVVLPVRWVAVLSQARKNELASSAKTLRGHLRQMTCSISEPLHGIASSRWRIKNLPCGE